jgi:hypothetical protein
MAVSNVYGARQKPAREPRRCAPIVIYRVALSVSAELASYLALSSPSLNDAPLLCWPFRPGVGQRKNLCNHRSCIRIMVDRIS